MANEKLKLKLEKFLIGKIPIHIVLKKRNKGDEPRFLNGLLIEKREGDVYVIDERKLGTTYVFIDDIYDIDVFVKSNNNLANDMIEKNGIHLGEGTSKEDIDLLRKL